MSGHARDVHVPGSSDLKIPIKIRFTLKFKVDFEWNGPIGAVLIAIADPDGGDALAVYCALVLVRWTRQRWAVQLVLAEGTV